MRATLVNPSTRRRSRSSKRRRSKNTGGGKLAVKNAFLKGKAAGMAATKRGNPKRRRRRNVAMPVARANPLILENPRRRRRRRRNPAITFEAMFKDTLMVFGGSGAGAAVNIWALNNIENMWIRNGSRLGIAAAATRLRNKTFGGAAAGAALYPLWQELFVMVLGDDAAGTGDLNVLNDQLGSLEADLGQYIDEVTQEELVG